MRLGGLNLDEAYSIIPDSSDNIIVTGVTSGTAYLTGDGDMLDAGENSTGYDLSDGSISILDKDGNS